VILGFNLNGLAITLCPCLQGSCRQWTLLGISSISSFRRRKERSRVGQGFGSEYKERFCSGVSKWHVCVTSKRAMDGP